MVQQRFATTLITERRRVSCRSRSTRTTCGEPRTNTTSAARSTARTSAASIELLANGRGLVLGPAWRRDRHLEPGADVDVVLEPEGPQRDDLADDIAAALIANPTAGVFFDSIAQFYRRAYLRYIDATTRRPDLRAARIAEVVNLLASSHKERPRP